MFADGYSEEMARRRAAEGKVRKRTAADWISLALAVPLAWAFWIYVGQPVWAFAEEVLSDARLQEERRASIEHMVGHCYKSGLGSTGLAIRIEDGDTVRLAFQSGITGVYPVSAISPAPCPEQ